MVRKKSSTPNRSFQVADQIQRDLAELIARAVLAGLLEPSAGTLSWRGADYQGIDWPDDAIAWLECRTLAIYDGGDHDIVDDNLQVGLGRDADVLTDAIGDLAVEGDRLAHVFRLATAASQVRSAELALAWPLHRK